MKRLYTGRDGEDFTESADPLRTAVGGRRREYGSRKDCEGRLKLIGESCADREVERAVTAGEETYSIDGEGWDIPARPTRVPLRECGAPSVRVGVLGMLEGTRP